MAIEIIEIGQKPGDKQYEVQCRACRTKFTFSRSDAKYTSDQRDGDFVSIKCPLCETMCHCSA